MNKRRGHPTEYVFISYKREDLGIARRVRTALENSGFQVWFDEDLQGGQRWESVIDEMLASAACIVVLWSSAASNSPWVCHEASHAMARDVYAPCRIELVSIRTPYNQIQATDLSDWGNQTNHPGLRDIIRRVT
jgi:hypothetical protein